MVKTYIEYLIEDLRRSTENEEFSELVGIPNRDFLRYMNDAQHRIHSMIVNKHPQVFIKDKTYTNVQGQREFAIPFDAHLGNQISNVKYKDSTGFDYYRLKPDVISNNTIDQKNSLVGLPCRYFRRSGKLILDNTPRSQGTLVMTYVATVPKLDLRRGQVSAVTLDTDTITNLTLNVVSQQIDTDALTRTTRVCIVDDEGNIKMSNIRISGVDIATGIVTIHPDHVFEDGETISVGDYIVSGPLSTTHIQLDSVVERYVMSYCTTKILQQEGSEELVPEAQTLAQMEQDIVASYADISDDFVEIADINDDDWY